MRLHSDRRSDPKREKAGANHDQAHNDNGEETGRSNIFAHDGTHASIGRRPVDHSCVSACLRRAVKTASSGHATVARGSRKKHPHGTERAGGPHRSADEAEFGVATCCARRSGARDDGRVAGRRRRAAHRNPKSTIRTPNPSVESLTLAIHLSSSLTVQKRRNALWRGFHRSWRG
jgi:hypothetical protein